MKNWKKRLFPVLAVACLFVFTVLFYGPLSLYLNNAQELFFSMSDLLKVIIPVSLAGLAVISALLMILPKKIFTPVLAAVFGLALCFYLQGNFLNISYGTGVLDGKEIDWNAYASYAALNTALWVLICLIPVAAWYFLKKKKKTQILRTAVAFAALFLILIQIPAMAVEMISFTAPEGGALTITDEGIFELSEGKNTLIFILDTYDEVYYEQFLANDPAFPNRTNGVVHFGNTLTSGATTMIAMPSILTGRPFLRNVTYAEYLKEVWDGQNPIRALAEAGTDVRIYSEAMYFSEGTADFVANFTHGEQKVRSYPVLGNKLYKLTFSKFFPHLLKRFVWFYTGEFEEAKEATGQYKVNDAAFYSNYLSGGFTFTDRYDNALRLYHLHGAHSPYTLGADGKKKEDATLGDQLAGSMKIVEDMLRDLQSTGHYDDTRVIITADHGDKHKSEQPFFLLKDFGAKGEYTSCDAPLSLFDLSVLFYDEAGVDFGDTLPYGMHWEDMLTAENRERRFFRNASGSSKVMIDEYKTTGLAGDYDALELVQSWEDPLGADAPYTLGEELSFTTEATGNRYALEGFGNNTGFRTKLHGPYALLEIPVADPEPFGTLTFNLKFHSNKINVKETVIKVNGKEYFRGEITRSMAANGVVFTADAAELFAADNVIRIELEFPEIPMEEMDKKVTSRTETLSLISITIGTGE